MKITGVTLEDSQELLNIYAPYVIETAITFEYDVPTLEVFTNRIENSLKSHDCLKAIDDEYLTNDSSHFHTKMGYKALGTFSRCGKKFGNVYDMVWFEKILDGRQI